MRCVSIILRVRNKVVVKLTIKLKKEIFEAFQQKYNLGETACAERMGISPSQLWKVKAQIHDPGKDFIAGALMVFPEASFDDLFFLPGVSRVRNTNQRLSNDEHAATIEPEPKPAA